ncbi:TPA: cytochrome c [Burkholderia aenigmatica]|uniref:c-type cytochrome n=1 Tax=Burkholderia sp. AU45251 TaxID=3059204 RepID=UPI00299A16B3|nr:cytochrome c [Burkholderia aenigmatica]HDR9518372.1 cytochrome c [Burkholderia aenigmatica]HDR9520507.1 cytochrome c [Burkholderia aenigmatica]HDR9595239.1 cytochrome c [Burkholderia aenigmatica]HDR9597534.1 cytochrome c [Burkholderia aenigmatica]
MRLPGYSALVVLSLIASAPASAAGQAADRVAAGKALAVAADCVACHTAGGGQPFAGGLAMPLPMGNIYSTNITPDKQTGIGNYSEQEFSNVLRKGVRRDGGNLYPAMPYPSYTKFSDDDIASLYAYFMHGVAPVHQANRQPDFPWPLTMRWPLKIWNALYLREGAYVPKPGRDAEWNRGAYLVQGAAHCGTCHTPRGIGMQELAYDETGTGYLAGAPLAGWQAFNITHDRDAGIGTWTTAQIVQYLRTGNVPGKAQAAGPMAEAVEHSFSRMSDRDLNAIATYLSTVPAAGGADTAPRSTQGRKTDDYVAVRAAAAVGGQAPAGASLYLDHCASCHGMTGAGTADGFFPSLFANSAVGTATTSNLLQVVMHGASVNNGATHYFMPAFQTELRDDEVVVLVNYLSDRFGSGRARVSAADVAKLRTAPAH